MTYGEENLSGQGRLKVVSGIKSIPLSGLFVTISNSDVRQAPTILDLFVGGGAPNTMIKVMHGVVELATAELNSDGYLNLGVPITADVGGDVGDHTLEVIQLPDSQGTEILYTVSVAAALEPSPPTPDVLPVTVPASTSGLTRKWVLQDPAVGGLGSWVFPINPREMTSPHLEFALTSKHTTAHSGQFHIFQAAMLPKEWVMTGYCPTEEYADKLDAYRDIQHRVYLIDHHGRAWKVVIMSVEIVPRLRHTYNGQISDWGSDFTLTVTITDQVPTLVD